MRGSTYVLLQSKKSESAAVVRLVAGLPGVQQVNRIRGPYDLVAQIGPGAHETVTGISDLPGVDRVVVCAPHST
jgi:hypothetical protein